MPPIELVKQLKMHSIRDATVIGTKASQIVQATVQYLAYHCPSIGLSLIKEAIADDTQDKGKLIKFAKEYLPKTYAVQGRTNCERITTQAWKSGPWFAKQMNKNRGCAITVCKHSLEAIAITSNLNGTYII